MGQQLSQHKMQMPVVLLFLRKSILYIHVHRHTCMAYKENTDITVYGAFTTSLILCVFSEKSIFVLILQNAAFIEH